MLYSEAMNRKRWQELWPVVIFTVLYLSIAAALALSDQNCEFVYYIVIVVILSFVALLVHEYVQLTKSVLWALSIWGLLHMIGGMMPAPAGWPISGTKAVFYSLWIIPNYLKYDHIVHAFGFGLATWICWQGIRSLMDEPKPTLGVLMLCALGGLGLGALNEVVEFIAVLTIPDTNVGDYHNTGWDLIANLIGSVVAAVLIRSFGGQYYKKQHGMAPTDPLRNPKRTK